MATTLYGTWRVTLPGEEYKWEPDETTVAEQFLLDSELAGLTFDQWLVQIDERRAPACQVLVWFLRYKEGRQEARAGIDFPIRKLMLEQLEEPGEAITDPEALAGSEPAISEQPSADTESGPGNSGD